VEWVHLLVEEKCFFFWRAVVANHLFAVYLTSFDCFLYSIQYIPCNETKAGPSQLKWFALLSNTCSIPYWENQGLWNPSKCWISSAHIPDLYHNLSIIPRPLQPEVFDHLQVINNWRRWRLRNNTTVFLCPLSCCTDKLNYIPTASPLWRRYMRHSSDMVNLYSSIRMGGHFNFITSNFMVVPMISAHLIQKGTVRIHRLLCLAGTASEWHRFHIWCMCNIMCHFKELLWLTNYLPFPLHYRLLCMT